MWQVSSPQATAGGQRRPDLSEEVIHLPRSERGTWSADDPLEYYSDRYSSLPGNDDDGQIDHILAFWESDRAEAWEEGGCEDEALQTDRAKNQEIDAWLREVDHAARIADEPGPERSYYPGYDEPRDEVVLVSNTGVGLRISRHRFSASSPIFEAEHGDFTPTDDYARCNDVPIMIHVNYPTEAIAIFLDTINVTTASVRVKPLRRLGEVLALARRYQCDEVEDRILLGVAYLKTAVEQFEHLPIDLLSLSSRRSDVSLCCWALKVMTPRKMEELSDMFSGERHDRFPVKPTWREVIMQEMRASRADTMRSVQLDMPSLKMALAGTNGLNSEQNDDLDEESPRKRAKITSRVA